MNNTVEKAIHHARLSEIEPFRKIINDLVSVYETAKTHSGEPFDEDYTVLIFRTLRRNHLLDNIEIANSFVGDYFKSVQYFNEFKESAIDLFAKRELVAFDNISTLLKSQFQEMEDFHYGIDEVSNVTTQCCKNADDVDRLSKHFPLHPMWLTHLVKRKGLSAMQCVLALRAEERMVAYTANSPSIESEIERITKDMAHRFQNLQHRVIYDSRSYIRSALSIFDADKDACAFLINTVLSSPFLKYSNFEFTEILPSRPKTHIFDRFPVLIESMVQNEFHLLDLIEALDHGLSSEDPNLMCKPSIISLINNHYSDKAGINKIHSSAALKLHDAGAETLARQIFIQSSSPLTSSDSLYSAHLSHGPFTDEELCSIYHSRRSSDNPSSHNIGAFVYLASRTGNPLLWRDNFDPGAIGMTYAIELKYIKDARLASKTDPSHTHDDEWWLEQLNMAILTLPEFQRSVSQLCDAAQKFDMPEILHTSAFKRAQISGDLSL